MNDSFQKPTRSTLVFVLLYRDLAYWACSERYARSCDVNANAVLKDSVCVMRIDELLNPSKLAASIAIRDGGTRTEYTNAFPDGYMIIRSGHRGLSIML